MIEFDKKLVSVLQEYAKYNEQIGLIGGEVMECRDQFRILELFEQGLNIFDEAISMMRDVCEDYKSAIDAGWVPDSYVRDCYEQVVDRMNAMIRARNTSEYNYSLQKSKSPYGSFTDRDFLNKLCELKSKAIEHGFSSMVFTGGVTFFSTCLFSKLQPLYSNFEYYLGMQMRPLDNILNNFICACLFQIIFYLGIAGYSDFKEALDSFSEYRLVDRCHKRFNDAKKFSMKRKKN